MRHYKLKKRCGVPMERVRDTILLTCATLQVTLQTSVDDKVCAGHNKN